MVRLHFADTDSSALSLIYKGNGKTISVHGWPSPEVSRKLRLPDFKTFGI